MYRKKTLILTIVSWPSDKNNGCLGFLKIIWLICIIEEDKDALAVYKIKRMLCTLEKDEEQNGPLAAL